MLEGEARILCGDGASRAGVAFEIVATVRSAEELLAQGALQGLPADREFHCREAVTHTTAP